MFPFLPLAPASTLPLFELEAAAAFCLEPDPIPVPRKTLDLRTPAAPVDTAVGGEIPRVLSVTSLGTFINCSAKWYYRKVLELPETPSSNLALGKAVHAAVGGNFAQKIETKEDLPTAGVMALFADSMARELDQVRLGPGESAAELMQMGAALVQVYMAQIAPRIEPAAVELPVEGIIGGVPVHGYVDLLTTDGTVIDLKTASKKPSGIAADHRLQLTTYAMLTPGASGHVRLDTLAKTKTVTATSSSAEITPADRRLAGNLYSIARDHMRAGLILPNRGSYMCSRKYCSFADQCEADYGGQVL